MLLLKCEFINAFEEEYTYIFRERPSGKFNRTVTLPNSLNASKAEAKNGKWFFISEYP